jgi:hypothetical protein
MSYKEYGRPLLKTCDVLLKATTMRSIYYLNYESRVQDFTNAKQRR